MKVLLEQSNSCKNNAVIRPGGTRTPIGSSPPSEGSCLTTNATQPSDIQSNYDFALVIYSCYMKIFGLALFFFFLI